MVIGGSTGICDPLLTADGAQATDAGHRSLADEIGPLLQTALGAGA